jgi:hypothetical protein
MRSLRSTPRGASAALLCRAACAVVVLSASACGDGGTGAGNPTPTVTHLDPVKVLQYSDSARVTVTGSSFVQGAVVRLNGSPRLTTYASPTQLTAVVPADLMQQAGSIQVSVFNPEPRGGASGDMALPVEHRVPDIQFLQPAGVQAGGEAFTLTVAGAGFSQASVVRWSGADRPTTFVNPGQVTAQIPAADVQQEGPVQVTVFNPAPGGGTSVQRVFTVATRPNPVPAIAALTPSVILAETGATFTITGTGFMTGSQVRVGGFAPTTTFVSATELRFSLEGSNLPNAGFAQVNVTNPTPGGGTSNLVQLRVDNPVPVLASLTPSQAAIGQDSQVVRITGTGFMAGTGVRVDGFPRTSRRISSTEMEFVMGAQELGFVHTISVRVVSPSPGGGESNALSLALVNPAPVIGSITPAQTTAGHDSLVVRVSGTGFMPASAGRLNGAGRTTRYVSRTALDVVLGAADLDEAGTLSITVTNPAPGGGTSAGATLTLSTPAPTLELIPSNGASAGRPGFPLVVHGTGFLASSVVRWNGSPRTTRFISSTRLEADITTADLASPGTASITVNTPGGGTSEARQMTVRAVGALSFTSSLTLPIQASDIAFDAVSGRLYAAVPSTAPAHANMVLAINPQTGAVVDSVLVGGNPGTLAISDDGSALWVALDATGQVRRLNLPSLTLGTGFSLGTERVQNMRVMPGRPGTVAISRRNTCCSPSHEGVAIYDNGVKRPQETSDHTGADLIVFGESASVMYGQGAYGGFYTLRVTDDGVAIVGNGALNRAGYQIEYANGRVYTGAGGIVDAGRKEEVGALAGGGSFVLPDPVLGRIFLAQEYTGDLRVFDMNTFQLLGEADVGLTYTSRMVRWGTDGLALVDGTGIRIYRTPIAGP